MKGVITYLIGIKTDGEKLSYRELSALSVNYLKSCMEDKDWIYKVIEMVEANIKEYKQLNARCMKIDLFDKEFDSIIHRMRELELSSLHLDEYYKQLKSETKYV